MRIILVHSIILIYIFLHLLFNILHYHFLLFFYLRNILNDLDFALVLFSFILLFFGLFGLWRLNWDQRFLNLYNLFFLGTFIIKSIFYFLILQLAWLMNTICFLCRTPNLKRKTKQGYLSFDFFLLICLIF